MPISPEIQALASDMRLWRQQIHSQPETAFQEHKTANFVVELLRSWDIEVHTGIGQTGVVGVIHGSLGSGPTIAFRADMDALPIVEEGQPSYRSVHHGVFHGCGHDGHTAILLGTARLLAERRDFSGTVVLIFQPAEEIIQGSRAMLDDGLLQRFPFEEIYALHNHPALAAGTVGVRRGAALASVDFFSIRIIGVGSHGGMPHLSVDPIMIGSSLVAALQSIVSRNVNPIENAVISVCSFQSGETNNVIPEFAVLDGTMRTLSVAVRKQVVERMREVCQGLALAHQCQIEMTLANNTPPTVNSPEQTQHVIRAAKLVVGADKLQENVAPIMAGDDCAVFLQERPGCYFLLGQDGPMCHHPHYDFNDDVASIGVAMFRQLVDLRLGSGRDDNNNN